MKGAGRTYQQTFIDTRAKAAFAKPYGRKAPIAAADPLNDRVAPFCDEHEVKPQRPPADRGTEFCGSPERHGCQPRPAVEGIDRARTKAESPQTNGIRERFRRAVLDEFCRAAFRKEPCRSIEELRADLDVWAADRNQHRPHQGRRRHGKAPMRAFLGATPPAREKTMRHRPQQTRASAHTANTACQMKS